MAISLLQLLSIVDRRGLMATKVVPLRKAGYGACRVHRVCPSWRLPLTGMRGLLAGAQSFLAKTKALLHTHPRS
jgi:hypothetical protein